MASMPFPLTKYFVSTSSLILPTASKGIKEAFRAPVVSDDRFDGWPRAPAAHVRFYPKFHACQLAFALKLSS